MAGFTLQPTSLPPNNSSENKLLSTFIHSESGHTQQVGLPERCGCSMQTVRDGWLVPGMIALWMVNPLPQMLLTRRHASLNERSYAISMSSRCPQRAMLEGIHLAQKIGTSFPPDFEKRVMQPPPHTSLPSLSTDLNREAYQAAELSATLHRSQVRG